MVGTTYSVEKLNAAIVKDFIPVIVDIDDPAEAALKAEYAPDGAVPQVVWASAAGEAYERSVESDEVDDILFAMEETLLGIADDAGMGEDDAE